MVTVERTHQTSMPLLQEETSVPEAIVRVLEQAGIDTVFGMPGGNTGAIYTTLSEHRSSIRTVLVREEALGGVMADIYGRLTGKPGVLIGQGAWLLSNASLGTLEALTSSSPMLLLGDLSDSAPYSQHAPYQSGTGEYGSWDAKLSFAGITKAVMTPQSGVQAVQSTQLAIKHALSGQRGPVALLYHSNSLNDRVGPDSLPRLYDTRSYLPVMGQPADPAVVGPAVQALLRAERPVIVAGNGVRVGQASDELMALAELLGAPVTTTAAGKGTVPETSDVALGVFGTFGTPVANAALEEADLVLAVGTKLAPSDTASEHPKLIDPTRQVLIQIDIESRNASWTYPVDYSLIGDAAAVLTQLHQAIEAEGGVSSLVVETRKQAISTLRDRHGFFDVPEFTSNAVPILPQRVIKDLQSTVADDAIVTCDAGENRIFMTHLYQTKAAGTFLQPAGIGGMGYAIPAALGAKVVHPDRQVIAVCGDGGFAISMNGLMTAREENIPIVVVVLNNNSLAWAKHAMGDAAIATDFADFDHAEIARAMGCGGIRVEDPGQIRPALEEALASNMPFVIDVRTSDQETFKKVQSPLVG